MDEKLTKLYNECIKELKSIDINMEDSKKIGEITISLAKRKAKRYGCCKQSEPLSTYYHIEYRNHRRIKIYDVFMKHNIEISKWVLELNDDIIKNTITLTISITTSLTIIRIIGGKTTSAYYHFLCRLVWHTIKSKSI